MITPMRFCQVLPHAAGTMTRSLNLRRRETMVIEQMHAIAVGALVGQSRYADLRQALHSPAFPGFIAFPQPVHFGSDAAVTGAGAGAANIGRTAAR